VESGRTAVDIYRESVEAMNAGDKLRFRSSLTDDAMEREQPSGQVYQGADTMTDTAWIFREAFPDLHGEVTNAFGLGDHGVMEVVWRGTHARDFRLDDRTLPATGKRIEWPVCYVFTVSDGKIAAFTTYFDTLTLFDQLGVDVHSGGAH
jgi:steroid delta-isomerase-like uncharacterized protein